MPSNDRDPVISSRDMPPDRLTSSSSKMPRSDAIGTENERFVPLCQSCVVDERSAVTFHVKHQTPYGRYEDTREPWLRGLTTALQK
eukprot:3497446-Prymnesium_polylepis.1